MGEMGNSSPDVSNVTPQAASSLLAGVITSLEANLLILEGLELTLAIALLDQALAEVKRHALP